MAPLFQTPTNRNPDDGMIFNSCSPFEFALSPQEIESWQPSAPRLGDEKIMQLRPVNDARLPSTLTAFDKHQSVAPKNRQSTFLHFYVADQKLLPLFRNPKRYIYRFSKFGGIIGPDLSVYRSMAPSSRTFHISANRALTRLFQDHGILTIPNVRWASERDFDFCFLGIPTGSVVATSTHGCCRTLEDRFHLRNGVVQLLRTVKPSRLLVYGPMPKDVFGKVCDETGIIHFPSEITSARKGSNSVRNSEASDQLVLTLEKENPAGR
jgi:hypothetical protein